ncbi:hypothetical protein FB45DRAFT_553915 [Roridomyces roridus]|uniref:FMR1-interacting protein 1 conserved domain-containing protein n=1 Tax=Roridomyces roridus TaxID=1738132 RepID=A0AAD7BUK1_9AGAR|nr:hypothetical protein FB45DRAFT_553915 [Roridomyces roridus]
MQQQPPAWGQQFYYSSHYAQAYMQQMPPTTTPQGYRPSSTYNNNAPPKNAPVASGSRFQPGHVRCTYKTCTFHGSPQSLETHMMDRHLIFPPGWDQRQKKSDWDADPSLKGKPIPIQGTTVLLDSPEKLAAWIAERKKRWPSAVRVEEKKRKLEEAVASGQLAFEDSGLAGARKRRRMDEGMERGRGRGRGRGQRGRGADVGRRGPTRPAPAQDSESSSDDSDDAPEVVSSHIEPVVPPTPPPVQAKQKPRPQLQPKQPAPNPFASRPTLLRNLLLPEIRMTVSNLSQAIRFLVDNDFLQNVELKPGQANERLIEVLHEEGPAPL